MTFPIYTIIYYIISEMALLATIISLSSAQNINPHIHTTIMFLLSFGVYVYLFTVKPILCWHIYSKKIPKCCENTSVCNISLLIKDRIESIRCEESRRRRIPNTPPPSGISTTNSFLLRYARKNWVFASGAILKQMVLYRRS